jgi:hypothetical protein
MTAESELRDAANTTSTLLCYSHTLFLEGMPFNFKASLLMLLRGRHNTDTGENKTDPDKKERRVVSFHPLGSYTPLASANFSTRELPAESGNRRGSDQCSARRPGHGPPSTAKENTSS